MLIVADYSFLGKKNLPSSPVKMWCVCLQQKQEDNREIGNLPTICYFNLREDILICILAL